MAPEHSMYTELAKYYDLIYDTKEYDKEAQKIKNIINKYKQSPGESLLDVGCGTGNHIVHFLHEFECVGVDTSSEVLNLARNKAPEADFIRQNMVDLDLGRKFDVIICLHSTIGYTKSTETLQQTIFKFENHLKAGGVLIIGTWYSPEDFQENQLLKTYQDENQIIVRLSKTYKTDGISIIDFHWLIADPNNEVYYETESHKLGLFSKDEIKNIMNSAGLSKIRFKQGFYPDRNLLLGMKSM